MSLHLFHLTGASSENRLNLGDAGVVEDARIELDRALDAGDQVALAGWSRRWGRQLIDRCIGAALDGDTDDRRYA